MYADRRRRMLEIETIEATQQEAHPHESLLARIDNRQTKQFRNPVAPEYLFLRPIHALFALVSILQLYIYIFYSYIHSSMAISLLIVIFRLEFLIALSRENISRAVLRFFQFPPIANRVFAFELFFESMKWTTLFLTYYFSLMYRFETNFVSSFLLI